MSNQLGRGYIEAACKAVGVKRGVYTTALRNRTKGLPLSIDQVNVLAKYKELVEDAKLKLQNL